jgi:hypothetical protein
MQSKFGRGDGPVEWLAAKAEERGGDSSSPHMRVFAVETK